MVIVGSKHFYVFEFTHLVTGEFMVPKRWIKFNLEMYGEVFQVTFDNSRTASIDDSSTVRVKVTNLRDTFLDLATQGMVPCCSGELFNQIGEVLRTDCHLRAINNRVLACNAQPRSDPCGR
jgi:hypothetical protein